MTTTLRIGWAPVILGGLLWGCGSQSADAPGTPGGSTCKDQGPAAGFLRVAATGGEAHVAMALDAAGDPALAYVADKELRFTRWDRCTAAFRPPVTIDQGVDVDGNVPARQVSLAFDRADGRFAVAYQKILPTMPNGTPTVWLAISQDGGATWPAPKQISEHDAAVAMDLQQAGQPAVAANAGKTWLAYSQTNRDCDNGTGAGTCSGTWLLEAGAPGGRHYLTVGGKPLQTSSASPTALALDSQGVPAVAVMVPPAMGYTMRLFFARASGDAIEVTHSNDVQNDAPSASLVFDGDKPRIAAHFVANDPADYDLIFTASNDGKTWTAPLHLPRDGSSSTAFFQSLAVAPGKAAVLATLGQATNMGACGGPRVVRSTDLVKWSACGADPKKAVDYQANYVNAAFDGSGKLVASFVQPTAAPNPGLYFWRE
jgi:hypothetical protein